MYLVAFFFLFLNNHHRQHFHSSVRGRGMKGEGDGRKEGTRGRALQGALSTSHTLGGCWRWWCRSRRQTPPGCFLYLWRRSSDSRFPYSESGSCSQTVLGCKRLRPRRCWVLEGVETSRGTERTHDHACTVEDHLNNQNENTPLITWWLTTTDNLRLIILFLFLLQEHCG